MTTRWDDEDFKRDIKQAYLDSDPSPETNAEILQQLGIDFDVSPNSIRVFLTREEIYVKKPAEVKEVKTTTKRVAKGPTVARLKELIAEKGKEVDSDVIDKLTGKAAQYFIDILS